MSCVSFVLSATKFGAMLDMLTDRCSTMCLLVNLSLLYPAYTFLFQLSMSLDIASHWLHLHRCAVHPSTCLNDKCSDKAKMPNIWDVMIYSTPDVIPDFF